ncbi:hypothetical protein RD110_20365 [Rhodoferax koreense]|uniref:Ice-binding protein C-terminal domain-containing protein n=1 Tax=Rhodoferax koreensis TaxID=1842727 RepID=A0A1P8JZV3_9BURK|nr:hypothetical protein RD110_20365 [Rhodoferax koreense]
MWGLQASSAGATTTLAYQDTFEGGQTVDYVNSAPVFGETVYHAGLMQFIKTDDGVSSLFQAYCVQLSQYSGYATNVYSLVDGLSYFGAEKADDLRRLMTEFDRWNGSSPLTAQATGALQMAIWEIVQETDRIDGSLHYDLASGNLIETSTGVGTAALAQGWLDGLKSVTSQYQISVYTNPTYQDYLVVDKLSSGGSGENHVPEPGSLALMLGALGVMGGVASRRKTHPV